MTNHLTAVCRCYLILPSDKIKYNGQSSVICPLYLTLLSSGVEAFFDGIPTAEDDFELSLGKYLDALDHLAHD